MVLVSAVVVMMVSGDDDVVVDDDGGWRVAVAVGGVRWGWLLWIGEMQPGFRLAVDSRVIPLECCGATDKGT